MANDDTERWIEGSNRAMDEHDPTQEPYASMSRAELFELMQADGLTGHEYERLNQFMLDKCSGAELERINFAAKLSTWLLQERNPSGGQQIQFISQVANEATAKLFDGMPPPGPLHEIN